MKRRDFIKKSAAAGISFVGVSALSGISCSEGLFGKRFNLMIKGATIIDGSGIPGYTSDIGIRGDRIIDIGTFSPTEAERVIDADGLILAPGFIDIHSHTDTEFFINPNAESKVRQGVTTEVAGQDGSSHAPLSRESAAEKKRKFEEKYDISVNWNSISGFLSALERNGLGINFATCIGLGTVRETVMGNEDRAPTEDELTRMKMLVDESIRGGAFGVSTGLEYTPGGFASTDEIIALCRVANRHRRPYLTHMRNEDDTLIEAVKEALRIGKEADVAVVLSHLKVSGATNWDKIEPMIKLIENARGEGAEVHFDRYPYIAYNTGLSNLFPIWAREGGWEGFSTRLNDDSLAVRIKEAVLSKVDMLGGWNSVMIGSVSNTSNVEFQGTRADEKAAESDQDPYEMIRSLLIREEGRTSMVGFGMSDENTDRILSHPLCMVCSDASAKATYGPLSESSPHPRAYGTFPRILSHYVREKKLFDLPTAIRKMTSMAAEKLGLKKRGLIAPRYYADLVLFDAETVNDKATFVEPHQYPEGIHYVLVNGNVVIENGEHTGVIAGRTLRYKA